ncbi:hypothetical protein OJ998_33435 [Solirubrobacter taibaiensis]|nr:hypothetical protein [Solirubrobacter taibaiensis]
MFARALWLILAMALVVPATARADAQVEGASYASSGTGALAFVNRSEKTAVSSLRVVSAEGVVSAPQTIIEGYEDPQVAIGPRGDVIVAWVDRTGLYARFQPAGGTLGPVELVTALPDFLEGIVPLAVDGAGNAFVAYTLASGAGGLHVRMRAASGVWGPEQALGGEHIADPTLAAAANGTALLAWRQHGGKSLNGTQIALSTRAPDAPAFTSATVIAGTPRHGVEPQLALNDRGDAVVTWIEDHWSKRPGARRRETVSSIHGRFRQAGGGFGKSVQLSHMSAAGQSVAVGPDGRMVLAWADWTNRRVEARVRSSTGVLGRPLLLTRDLGVNATIAALAAGRGAVGWIDRDPGLVLVRVAHATKDRRFGPPQLVARVDGYDLDPVWTATPTSLAVVPSPPGRAERPIRWQRVPLDAGA